ncbi:hypothetical protein GPJ56_001644 [Histomonas meleagridis]|uniref:uncharacterized protein n=1 Tax=Histomonas meleagridis TaxID=135588 RepID=UPI00355AADB2|nr:hypothetical protein GPJ56_001644 [Histomonas meleagridis]KAH0796270.1 hypothetical protein GO595_010163 [Histomonas meleagridis]
MLKRGIRTGRPKFHIRARFITYEGSDGIEKYQLDSKGRLINADLINPSKVLQAKCSTPPTKVDETEGHETNFDDFEFQGYFHEYPPNNEVIGEDIAFDEIDFANYQLDNFYDNNPFSYGDGL